MRTSLYHKCKHVLGMSATSITTNTTTFSASANDVDLAQTPGSDWRSCLYLITGGTITDGTYTFTIYESDDDVTYAAAPADSIIGPSSTITATAGTAEVEYVGNKRYCRLAITSTSVTSGGSLSARALLYGTAAFRR
jgi:hypothetical protein